MSCVTCDRSYDLPDKPGVYRCRDCGAEYWVSTNVAPAIEASSSGHLRAGNEVDFITSINNSTHGSTHKMSDLRARLAALADRWDSERAEWVKNGVLNYSIALERTARELRAELRKEAK